ncbi:MAG: hypothetical protein Q9207_004669, partial [Kuettlingeria erythrocarpa]
SGWEKDGVRGAGRIVEATWEMMSDERHVSKEDKKMGEDPKTRPEIVGVLLWVRALRSVLLAKGKDDDGKVKRAAEMLMAVWKDRDCNVESEDWVDANHKLMMWVPVWHGMCMARNVLGENTQLGRSLGTGVTEELEPLVTKAAALVGEHVSGETDRRGRVLFQELSKVGR